MLYAILAAFLLMVVFYLAYQRIKTAPGHSKALACAVKCAATAMAAAVALLGCLQNGTAAHWVLLAGLTACAVADGVLCCNFMAGGAIFALGHILYMASFCLMHRPDWRSVLLLLALMGLPRQPLPVFARGLAGAIPSSMPMPRCSALWWRSLPPSSRCTLQARCCLPSPTGCWATCWWTESMCGWTM